MQSSHKGSSSGYSSGLFNFSPKQKGNIIFGLALLLITEIIYSIIGFSEVPILAFVPTILISLIFIFVIKKIRKTGTIFLLSLIYSLLLLAFNIIVLIAVVKGHITFWWIVKQLLRTVLFSVLLEEIVLLSDNKYYNRRAILVAAGLAPVLLGNAHVPSSWRANSFWSYLFTAVIGLITSYIAIFGFPKKKLMEVIDQGLNSIENISEKVSNEIDRAPKPTNNSTKRPTTTTSGFSISSDLLLPLGIGIIFAIIGFNLGPFIVYGDQTSYLLGTCDGVIDYLWCGGIGVVTWGFTALFGIVGFLLGKLVFKKK
ncbi:MAG: hypothetical protein H0S79_21335 [Anaerolineaceae bacterium]|nr:hypothetical protein [Anaerolineaceae bacterium]